MRGLTIRMGIAVRFVPKREKLEKLQKSFPDMKPYYLEAIQAVFQLSADLEKAIDQHFKKRCQFSRARYLILIVLIHCESQKMSPHEIAEKLNVTRGNMTGLIDGLIKDGYVTKLHDTKDRRQVWIQATPQAQKYLDKIMPEYFRRLARLMSMLTKNETETLTALSRKLLAGVDAFNAD